MKLDLDFVHRQFPQSADHDGSVFCTNAGGSFVARQVLDIFEHYNGHQRIQPYASFSPSREAGMAMDRAKSGWSEALNIEADELTLGPSTSINSYVMAQAIAESLTADDEIVVCQQDHEANHGVWRRMAERSGAIVRQWDISPDSGLLDPEDLYARLTDKTRWVFFTHCSNLIGTINPVAEIVAGIKQRSPAKVCVDGVAYAPHHIPDLKALGVDIYLFSLYKVFGPHQGVMYVNSQVQDSLTPQSHHFLANDPGKRFNPAGPQHAEVAASAGVLDYFSALTEHHGIDTGTTGSENLQSLHQLIAAHERSLAAPILDFLHQSPRARLLGKHHTNDGDRAATIAFKPLLRAAQQVVGDMQRQGICVENGHFYAQRVLEGVGIDTTDGVVRISMVHYNTAEDVQKILAALDQCLVPSRA